MKIALTADIHIGVSNKLEDSIWALNKIRNYCIDNNIQHIFILGDLLHDREYIQVKDLNSLVDFLTETSDKYGIQITAFPGNHDMYLKNSWEINGLKPLSGYLKAYHKISNFKLGGVRFWVVPFIHYESKYMETITKLYKKHRDGDVLLTHVGVKTSNLNMCFLIKSWSIVDFTDSPFDRIYTGHFHIHQQVGDNLWYPGSPIPYKFDEGNTNHGFLVFDTNNRTHEFIDLFSDVDDNTPPQFWTIDDTNINDSDDKIHGNIVRVALSHEYTHNQLAEIRKELHKRGAKDIRWMNLASKEEKETIIGAKNAASADHLFERYIEHDKKGIKKLNKKLLLQLNSNIVADGDRIYAEEEWS